MKQPEFNFLRLEAKLLCVGISCFIAFVISYLWYWVHESGHVLSGFIVSLSKGLVPSFKITNWVYFLGLPAPQQTTTIANPVVYFSGSILTIIISILVSLYLYNSTKKRIYFLFILAIFLLELGGNFLCGTDNMYHKTYALCGPNAASMQNVAAYIFMVLILIILTKILCQKYSLYFEKGITRLLWWLHSKLRSD